MEQVSEEVTCLSCVREVPISDIGRETNNPARSILFYQILCLDSALKWAE